MIALPKRIPFIAAHNVPLCLLLLFFIFNLTLRWPGIMSPDAQAQLQEAIAGTYSDHHPPIMAFLWRMFNYFLFGSGSIFLFHLMLLYGACYLFMRSFQNKYIIWYYTLYPLFLPIFLYSAMIWKDVGFAFAYLLVMAGITYFITHQKKPSSMQFLLLSAALFYGTAVKFQGIYLAPIACFGIAYLMQNFKFDVKTILYTSFYYGCLILSITLFNNSLVDQNNKSNSWKFVKIYDLAGMSILLNKPIFPDYITKYPKYSFTSVKAKFNYERVDDIVFFSDSPIPRVETEQNRNALLALWRSAILHYPIVYAQHRFQNWSRIICAKPFEKLDTMKFEDYGHNGYLARLQNAANDNKNRSWEHYLGKCLITALHIIKNCLNFIFVFVCMILYILLALCRRSKISMALFLINGTALVLVLALFPFCMASSLRYVYLSVCLVHASHPIAYLVWKRRTNVI